jgi:hypothetical protein
MFKFTTYCVTSDSGVNPYRKWVYVKYAQHTEKIKIILKKYGKLVMYCLLIRHVTEK